MGQTRLLSRTFFARLFESDLMPEGLPQVQLVIWGALLASTPTTWKAVWVADTYQGLQFLQPLGPEFAADRMTLITLSMMVMGAVGLLLWDGVFPDRRDVRVLGVLPVPTRRFVLGRLAALSQVYLIFATPVCVLQSVVFPLAVAGFGDTVPRAVGIAAHLLTVLCTSTFVFASLVAVQCVLLLAGGRRAAQHVSVAFQLLFAVGLVQLLVFLPELRRVLREGGADDGLWSIAALPPAWFFGLYELLVGRAGDAARTLGMWAAGLTAGSVAVATLLYAATYDLLSRRALEGPPPRGGAGPRRPVSRLLNRLPPRGINSPLRAAIRQFGVRTLARSRYHRMVLAVYAGIALAIMSSSALSVAVRDHGAALWRPGITLLSLPLIFQFLMLVGLRVVPAVPAEPRARWVFRLCEPADRLAAVTATRDMMLLLVVAPAGLFALLHGLVFWDVRTAASHAVFCLATGLLFAELLLAGSDKVPFACTYYPGKSRVFTLWPLYVMAFFLYSLLLSAADLALTTRPRGLLLFCAGAVAATALLTERRRRALARLPGLRFEEEDPDRMFQGFNLSEALAASPRPRAATPPAASADGRLR